MVNKYKICQDFDATGSNQAAPGIKTSPLRVLVIWKRDFIIQREIDLGIGAYTHLNRRYSIQYTSFSQKISNVLMSREILGFE